MVEIGQQAPDFQLQSSTGQTVCLAELAGQIVVLYFYPKDDTTGCTTEACQFRDTYAEFQRRGVVVYGVSPDSLKSHDKFRQKYELNFPLLSDPEKTTLKAYGVWQEKSMYGRTYMGVVRTTFIIGPDGKILAIFPRVQPDGHSSEILAWLDQHQPNMVNRDIRKD